MKKFSSHKAFIHILVVIAIALLPVGNSFASGGSEGGFDAGSMIMHHVTDAHEIHLLTLHKGTPEEHHVSIPLPIIIYTADKGIEVFSSSRFHNPEHKYGRYLMEHEHIYISNEAGGLDLNEEHKIINAQPLDLSITKTVGGILITIILMFLVFMSLAKSYKRNPNQAPKGLQAILEPLILFITEDVAKPSIGEKKYMKFVPFLLTVFFFIWFANMLGLIPFIGGFNVTGNIAVTLVLALITFIITTVSANKNYWLHIVATPGVPLWLLPLMIPIEIIGMFSKPIVLCLRLFANITAGHIIILAFMSLIFIFSNLYGAGAGYGASILSLLFAIFMNLMELLVAFLQAYVFTLLSALYFGMAVEEHH
jgi:F-type H+-transporting ATPase subunit a